MPLRKYLVCAASILIGIGILPAQSRRAVLVGINNYNPDPSVRSRLQQQPGISVTRAKTDGDATYWRFDNLDGAISDVALMKTVLADLGVNDFVILRDQEATAAGILNALQKNFVDDAKPGDLRIFYYSGHGNHIRNLASREQGGEDQTIVPADNWRDVSDVRDKEISRILWQAVQKGVRVTFIADSCHSGSLSRGAWNAARKVRSSSGRRGGTGANAPREPVANDPADLDPATNQPIDPEKAGVLTLAAAQATEEAREIDTEDGPHGAFTWALARALKYQGESMNQVFQRVSAELHASGIPQQPVMGGLGRGTQDLLGQPADSSRGLRILAESVSGKEVRLRGGKELELYPECVLKSVANPALHLKITASNLGSSIAAVLGDGSVKAGDLFSVERWVVPAKAGLRVFLPPTASAEALRSVVLDVGKLKSDSSIDWVEDASAGIPTHIMSWTGTTWILEQNPAQPMPADLGPAPAAGDIRRLLPDRARFLLIVPPTPALIAALQPVAGVEVAKQRADAQYWLGGRLSGDSVQYSWLLSDATQESARQIGDRLPLPTRSDWFSGGASDAETRAAADSLRGKSRLLARIRGWLTLESPPSQGTFPYHLALRNTATGEFRIGNVRDGENYKLYLKADDAALKGANLAQRWVYVFVIDSFGESTLLYPAMQRGNDRNLLPYAQLGDHPKFESQIPLTGDEKFDLTVTAPFGVDSYFLLTSQDAIDPAAFSAEGVRTRAGTRGGAAADPLSELLSDVNTGTRGARKAETPATWSIEGQSIRSVEK
jgi:caspase domain-containing protein